MKHFLHKIVIYKALTVFYILALHPHSSAHQCSSLLSSLTHRSGAHKRNSNHTPARPLKKQKPRFYLPRLLQPVISSNRLSRIINKTPANTEPAPITPEKLISEYEALEKDLENIRQTSEERFYEDEGFEFQYYDGLNEALEMNRIAVYLRNIQADPYTDHVPYFADRIPAHIAKFEKELKTQTENITERLNVLEEFKQEAQIRIENQEVTYDWWVIFHMRLAFLASPPSVLRAYKYDFHRSKLRKNIGIEEIYKAELFKIAQQRLNTARRLPRLSRQDLTTLDELEQKIKEADLSPADSSQYSSVFFIVLDEIYQILHPSKETNNTRLRKTHEDQAKALAAALEHSNTDLHDIDYFKTHEGMKRALRSHLIYLDSFNKLLFSKFNAVQPRFPEHIIFWSVNKPGIMAFNRRNSGVHFLELTGKETVSADSIQGASIDYALHDAGHIYFGRKLSFAKEAGRMFKLKDKIKIELAWFIFQHELEVMWENFIKSDHPYEQKQYIQTTTDMMTAALHRFTKPNDLQELLPGFVNKNDPEEVESFLLSAGAFFGRVLLSKRLAEAHHH